MKRIAIMQPYFFPYLGYFQLIHSVDTILFYDKLNYIKNGWINRNRILAINSNPFKITVPISKESKSSYNKISDIKITADDRWKRKILTSIFLNYARRPYFDDVFPLLKKIIETETNSISKLNVLGITEICRFLEIATDIQSNSESYLEVEHQLEHNQTGQSANYQNIEIKSQRVLEICNRLNAMIFVNPIGGRELYSKEVFAQHDVELFFIRSGKTEYKQASPNFVPDLSIIDVLMNCGKNQTRKMLKNYELI